MDIVTAIKVELVRKSMKMSQLADRLGISRQTFSKKMNGHVGFTIDEVCQIAANFGMTPVELLSNAEEENEKARSGNCGQ